jgi:hypothetical protein
MNKILGGYEPFAEDRENKAKQYDTNPEQNQQKRKKGS